MYERLEFKDFQAGCGECDKWDLSHKHSSYEIFMLDEGEMTVCIGKRSYSLKPGYVFLTYPNIWHRYMEAKPSLTYEITFTDKFLDTFFTHDMKESLLLCYTSEVLKLADDEKVRFKAVFNEIIRQKRAGEDYPIEVGRLLAMLKVSSERCRVNPIPSNASNGEVSALANAVSYINGNYRCALSLDEIAEKCFISKSYLCKMFKKEYGMTVMSYLRKVRIGKACDFLATTDKDLSLIAGKMGFVDLSHFTRVFKKETGMLPREYRMAKNRERAAEEDRQT